MTFLRIMKVVKSCKTPSQFESALKYAELGLRRLYPSNGISGAYSRLTLSREIESYADKLKCDIERSQHVTHDDRLDKLEALWGSANNRSPLGCAGNPSDSECATTRLEDGKGSAVCRTIIEEYYE